MLWKETSQAEVRQVCVKSRVSSLVRTSTSKYLRSWPVHLFHSTFLHIHAWHTQYAKTGEQCSLEFDIKHAGIAGMACNFDTLIKHSWTPSIDWMEPTHCPRRPVDFVPGAWRCGDLLCMPWDWILPSLQQGLIQPTSMCRRPIQVSRMLNTSKL